RDQPRQDRPRPAARLIAGRARSGLPAKEPSMGPLYRTCPALVVAIASIHAVAWLQASSAADATLEDAQRLFYNGRYEAAAALALTLQAAGPDALAARELRTSALHFQIRRALG